MPSSHLILCRPLLLLPPIPPNIKVFSNRSTLGMRWPKYWSFSVSIIPSKEIPGLISFRMDRLDLLAVQGTLKSSPTPQFKSISSSVLNFLHSPTLTSIHTTGKTIALTRQTFVGKVMSLLFNMLSRLHSISFIHLFNFFICFYCIHARIKSQIHSHWNIFFLSSLCTLHYTYWSSPMPWECKFYAAIAESS